MTKELDVTVRTLNDARQVSKKDVEFWMARDLQIILGYSKWQTFHEVVKKAVTACKGSGVDPKNQFTETSKMVKVGSGAKVQVLDYYLSRYACYLIAMNGDSTKLEIAAAQTYFAIQTRKQEIQDNMTEDERRIYLRNRVKDANKNLAGVAQEAGVQRFGIFQDAGYRGLYDMGLSNLKEHKNIGKKEDLLDRIGRTELAANEFRITQTEDKLVRLKVKDEARAIQTHREVGAEVRNTIRKIGGTMPENLPTEPPIKEIERKLKNETKALNC